MRIHFALKYLLLGSLIGATTVTALAADAEVQAAQSMSQEEARREAVRSTWRDRTDIVIGAQSYKSQAGYGEGSPNVETSHPAYLSSHVNNASGTDVNAKFYVETLHPVTHYDENSKSVVFVQGGAGRNGEKIKTVSLTGGRWVMNPRTGYGYLHPVFSGRVESVGTTANIGVGYRRLSKDENAFWGANAFYDHAFTGGYNRVSAGAEYVAGYNEFRINVYRGLGGKKNDIKVNGYLGNFSGNYYADYLRLRNPDGSLGGISGGVIRYDSRTYDRALGGIDFEYARTFKNARWLRAYIDGYYWQSSHPAVRPGLGGTISGKHATRGFKVGAEMNLTPHLTMDIGFQTGSGDPKGVFADNGGGGFDFRQTGHDSLNGIYVMLRYTLGKSRFAWHGGKHSDDVVTVARAKMLDKVRRSELVIDSTYQEAWDGEMYSEL